MTHILTLSENDYFHASVACTTSPCEQPGAVCNNGHGHDAHPTCCDETVDGVPCVAVWRDSDGTLVDCEGGTTPCETDADCAEDFWCRPTEHVALSSHGHGLVRRQCVPFAPAGAACGGFGFPWFIERCRPELTCVVDHALPDLPGVCSASAECDPSHYYATCTADAHCRDGFRCSAPLDGVRNERFSVRSRSPPR